MKTIFYIRIICAMLAAVILAAACDSSTTLGYDSAGNSGSAGGDDNGDDGGGSGSGGGGSTGNEVHPSQVSVAYLRSLAAEHSVTIDLPYSIRGTVTANDSFGEYFKTICVEDSTGGIEVLIDGYALYTLFALYDEVCIECHGLAVGRYGSRTQLGAPPTGEYAVDRIAWEDTGRYISVGKDAAETFMPVGTSIAELRPEHVGRTVRIDGLHALAAGLGWCDADPQSGAFADSERTVADDSGAELTVLLRGTCIYAADPVPEGRFALCGIVEYRAGEYALRITNRGIYQEYD